MFKVLASQSLSQHLATVLLSAGALVLPGASKAPCLGESESVLGTKKCHLKAQYEAANSPGPAPSRRAGRGRGSEHWSWNSVSGLVSVDPSSFGLPVTLLAPGILWGGAEEPTLGWVLDINERKEGKLG